MLKHLLLISNCLFFLNFAYGQTIISDLNEVYTQDFNQLSDTSLSNSYETLSDNWFAVESGSGANAEYRAAYGQYAGGDLYSFGDSLSTERALGSIGSGSVSEISFGTAFTNSTNDTIRAIHIKYFGEMWRLGNPGRTTGPDTLVFSYAVNPVAIDNGEYIVFNELNFHSPTSTGTANSPLIGNDTENRRLLESTILVKVAPDETIWIKWTDYNSSSYDDGLAIDDLEVKFLTGEEIEDVVETRYIPINNLNETYFQDFNTLSDTTLTNSYETLPEKWMASESGSGANHEYRAAYGELAGGDLYSFGEEGSTDRALGSIGSGAVSVVSFGVAFTNLTEETIKSVVVKYTGEMWRLGNPERATGPDSLFFSYAVNAGNINQGDYALVENLHFSSPVTSGTANAPLNGNDEVNTTVLADTIPVNLLPNEVLWIRWTDYNSSSYDDGLAVDDLEISFLKEDEKEEENSASFISISEFNDPYLQDFNTLSNIYGVSSFETLPKGWYGKENGANSDVTYNVSYGEFGGGNIYSFGDSASTDRALGSIGSGTNNLSFYGAAFVNNTGETIDNIQISYVGEQWRQGRPGRTTGPDTLHFSYAINAKDIESGNYSSISNLNFFSPREDAELNTPLNGNSPENRNQVQHVLFNLDLSPGDTIWIRWKDSDSHSFDDGLAIDSFSLTAIQNVAIPEISFSSSKTYIDEIEGLIDIELILSNASDFISQAEVFIADTGTVDLHDFTLTSSILQFSKENTVQNFSIILNNKEPFEEEEYFVLGIRNLANAGFGAIKYDTVYIRNYEYPQYLIADISSVDEEGVAENLGQPLTVSGIIHGVNLSSSNWDFYILENGRGINVYSSPLSEYQPKEGDEIKIWGAVSQYRGLTRIESLDSLEVVAENLAIETPTLVSAVLEENESEYITIKSLQLAPAIVNWPENDYVTAVNENLEEVRLYISSQSEYAGTPAPSGTFSVTGLGSQFSESYTPPFIDGYRVVVLKIDEGEDITAINDIDLATESIYPNPFNDHINIKTEAQIKRVVIRNVAGYQLFESSAHDNEILIPTQNFNPGLYLIQVETENTVKTFKVIKK